MRVGDIEACIKHDIIYDITFSFISHLFSDDYLTKRVNMNITNSDNKNICKEDFWRKKNEKR